VPTIGHAHFAIDLQTLFAVVVFLSAVGGLLLLFCWMQNRNTPALVAPAPLVMFETSGMTAQRAVDMGATAALAVPMAG
jgi:hypothetical protein